MPSLLVDILRRGANDIWGLNLSPAQLAQFERYAELLAEWNATRLNLTRITTPEGIAVKHFLDSLSVLKAADLPLNARVVDVGTGAGFPGLPLKIARPDLRLVLLDSTAKKLAFCRAVADDLTLDNVETLHARAEDAAQWPARAGRYDIALARAVAPLERLLPWTAPFVRPGGLLIALKGTGVDTEMPTARPVARRLGLTFLPSVSLSLPEANEPMLRQIVLLQRVSASR